MSMLFIVGFNTDKRLYEMDDRNWRKINQYEDIYVNRFNRVSFLNPIKVVFETEFERDEDTYIIPTNLGIEIIISSRLIEKKVDKFLDDYCMLDSLMSSYYRTLRPNVSAFDFRKALVSFGTDLLFKLMTPAETKELFSIKTKEAYADGYAEGQYDKANEVKKALGL